MGVTYWWAHLSSSSSSSSSLKDVISWDYCAMKGDITLSAEIIANICFCLWSQSSKIFILACPKLILKQRGREQCLIKSCLFLSPRLPSAFRPRGERLTSLDASFARCFAFWRTSSKTSTSMFFQKNRQNIASLRKKHDVLHDVLGFRNSIQSYHKSLIT